MDNPHPPGNRPMSVAPDPGRGRTPEPDAPRGRRHSLADVLAAVMLLLATLTYLGRLVWGLSQPGYEIQARDFGSLLAAIIAIPAGVLLVTGMKPAVGRLTGALGAGAMLLFNVVNLAGGSVDDVIGKYGTWAAIPIVVTTAIAIVALYRASWSPEVRIVAADAPPGRDEEFAARRREDEFDAPRYPDEYPARPRPEDRPLPSRSAPAAEQTGGVIGAPAPALEPAFAEVSPPEPSEQAGPEPAISGRPAPERQRAEAAQNFSTSDGRATTEGSSLKLPEMSLPEPGPAEAFAPESPLPPQDRESGFAASGPAGSAPHPQQSAPAGAPSPAAQESYVPERLESPPAASDSAASGPVPPQQGRSVAQTPATEPFAQPDPALLHAATDGIPAVPPVDPPTAVLPRPDFTANPQQARPPVIEPPRPGPVTGAPPAGPGTAEPDRQDGFRTPPPFPPPGGEPPQPGHVIAPNGPAPETAPLNMGRPGTPQPPRSEVPSGRPRNGFADTPAPYQGNPQPGNPPQGNGPVHQPFGPPQNTPYPPGDAPQNSLRLPGIEPGPDRTAPPQPVLRRPGGFLAPPPVEPEPAPGWSPPNPVQPHPDGGRPQLHDVSASERPGPHDPQPAHAEEEAQPPVYLDHRQSPPKRLAPPPWAQEQ